MTKQEFADLIFRLEELLIEADFWRYKIGNCGGACRGSSEEDYRKLCLACSKALKEEMDAVKRLSKNAEFNETMRMVKEAVDRDTTGEFKGILDLARRATVH